MSTTTLLEFWVQVLAIALGGAGLIWILFKSVRGFVRGFKKGYANEPTNPQVRHSVVQTPVQPSSPSMPNKLISSRIFISYRREDSADVAGRIYDRLIVEFGKPSIFKDVDELPLGEDFRDYLDKAVAKASVVLAVIGQRWAGNDRGAGAPRIYGSRDFIRIELSSALERGIPVIPVLVSRAKIPDPAELPDDLANLVYRNAIEVRPDPDFHKDVDRLIRGIHHLLSRLNTPVR